MKPSLLPASMAGSTFRPDKRTFYFKHFSRVPRWSVFRTRLYIGSNPRNGINLWWLRVILKAIYKLSIWLPRIHGTWRCYVWSSVTAVGGPKHFKLSDSRRVKPRSYIGSQRGKLTRRFLPFWIPHCIRSKSITISSSPNLALRRVWLLLV